MADSISRTTAAQRYRDARWLAEILRQTPKEVWQEYRRDGIDIKAAVRMEASYA